MKMLENKVVQEKFEALKAMNFLVKSLNNEGAYYGIWTMLYPMKQMMMNC